MRTIFHVDMDAFFASVEVLCNPKLRGKPVIVSGSPETRSVVSSTTYETRKFGIRSGMSAVEARMRCPQAIFVEGNPKKYLYYSMRIQEILFRFSPQMEPFSIDEAFLEVAPCWHQAGRVESLAFQIKQTIKEELFLTASVGAAANKMMAKIGSKMNKPDGVTVIRPEQTQKVLWSLPVEKIWGVGEKTSKALNDLGVVTVQDLAQIPVEWLIRVFGKNGEALRWLAQGIDPTPVKYFDEEEPPKSLGHDITLEKDSGDEQVLLQTLCYLADKVASRLRREQYKAGQLTLKIKYSNFRLRTSQMPLLNYSNYDTDFFGIAQTLWKKMLPLERGVRMLGLSASKLLPIEIANAQQTFFDAEEKKVVGLCQAIDRIRHRFGQTAIARGRCIE
ncbi:MAG TPA: DNA polymerase IV [bacterium]|nr:DNA polymerase IV [bacterium]